jgi:alpha-L-fucosidase
MTRTIVALLLATCIGGPALAQKEPLKVNPNSGETEAQFAARTKWWREAKFGMFIHWGVYSIPADGEWHMNAHGMQVKDYEKYVPQFNPTKFDAAKWVRVAKAAGMKYITITSKHHDGFCMFDSKLTDYSIVKATPYAKDPMVELAAECKKQGIKLCFYHSIMDWHHPDYLPRREWEKQTRPAGDASLDKYIEYMKGQLTELLTKYGPIGGIWFDGGWEHSTAELHSLEVVNLIRKLQPGIMINDRINLPEDYSTPEQSIPAGAMPGGRLWETCMTLNNNWGYARDDHNWKSVEDLVHKICDIAGKGGNFLLNVGPTELGEIPDASIERLEAVGKWMKANGKGVYGTTKSPFNKLPFEGRCTRKGRTLYLHVFKWPDDGRLPLPAMKAHAVSAKVLATGQKLEIVGNALVGRPDKPDPYATTVEVKLSGDPEPIVVEVFVGALSNGRFDLKAADADLKGGAQLETIDGVQSIGYWTNAEDSVVWGVDVPKAGSYTVEAEVACPDDAAGSTVIVGGASLVVPATGDWHSFRKAVFDGTVDLKAGKQKIALKVKEMKAGAVMNLRVVRLIPAK